SIKPAASTVRPTPAGNGWGELASIGSLAILVLVSFGLRVVALGTDSLWYDETYSVYLARHGVAAISTQLFGDHVPLHYYLLDGWMRLAGSSEYASRFLSVAFGLACIPLVGQLLRQLGVPRKPSLVGSAMLAFAGLDVYYSQEARPHMLACLLGIAAAY